MKTTPATFDEIRANNEGATYLAQFIGLTATVKTWAGEVLTGTVERFERENSGRPIVRFEDGRWAFGSTDAMFAN